MKEMKVRVEFFEQVLGMTAMDAENHDKFIASNAPTEESRKEEMEAVEEGLELAEEKEVKMTVFPRDKDGNPIFWDYQLKGFFKDACGMLRRVKDTKCSKLTSYKKVLDGLLFPTPREVIIHIPEGSEMGHCERPLRAQTMQGERIALANSESAPAGTWIEFSIKLLDDKLEDMVLECLDYGELRGMGQWRNSGTGRFTYKILDDDK